MAEHNAPVPAAPDLLLRTAYPASRPSDAFRRRMGALSGAGGRLAAQAASTRSRTRLIAVTATVALAALAAPALGPRLATAYRLRAIASACANARTAHSITWSIGADGRRANECESWRVGGNSRAVTCDGVERVVSGSTVSEYLPSLDTVRLRTNAPGDLLAAAGGTLAWPLSGWRTQLGAAYGVSIAGEVQAQGRRALKVVVELQRDSSRQIVYVDPRTNLPFRADIEMKLEKGYQPVYVTEYEFGTALPVGVLRPTPHLTARSVDMADTEGRWRARFERIVASETVDGQRIAIRDIQANAHGDLFVLFTDGTAGNRPSDLPGGWYVATATDDRQTRYDSVGSPLFPTVEGGIVGISAYTYRGEMLHGAWVMRDPSTPAPAAHTVTLNFSRPRGSIGAQDALPSTGAAVINVTVAGPSCAVTPDYMPYMSIPVSPAAVELERARSLARTYEATPKGYPRAAAEYRKMLSFAATLHGGSALNSDAADAWYGLYCCLSQMGQPGQARDALLGARDAADGSTMYGYDRIGEALKSEGLR